MNYLEAFKHFDPKTGECPKLFNDQFNEIAERARSLLKNSDNNEIEKGLRKIDRIIHSIELDINNTWIMKAGGRDVMVFDNSVTYLRYHMNNYDNSDPRYSIDNIQWPGYFAILALALIGQAKSIERINHPYLGFTEEHIENSNRDLIIDCLADSTEAMDYADSLIKIENIKKETAENAVQEINKKQSYRNRKAANKRFLDNVRIKNEFVPYFKNGDFKSRNKAAEQYYESLSVNEKSILCPTVILENAVRTLLAHLRRDERQNNQSPEMPLE